MFDSTIDLGRLEVLKRHVIDAAVHNTISSFSGDLGDNKELAYRLAHAAVEQLAVHCNQELRRIGS